MGFLDRLWNVFTNSRDPTRYGRDYSYGGFTRSYIPRFTRGNERSIVTSVYNRIAIDVAQIDITHCQLDEEGRYTETIEDCLNQCLSFAANIDQTSRAFIQDAVITMLDTGHVVLLPVETSDDPELSDTYDILSLRTGKVVEWYPRHVKVSVYNERTGEREDVIVKKQFAAIVYNPLYAVMNEPNSTMQRLIRKLNILDAIDEQSGSGKLDIIIQLPYVVKTEARRKQAEERRKDIEMQLSGSKYGIAYTDGTEHITQLNRPAENNMMKQIEYLTSMLYSQLGITQGVMDGTADETTMLNYNNRTVEPIVSALVDEMKRKFLSPAARMRRESIEFFRDPFKLVPVNDLAEMADKFTRNEILSKNEIRQIIGRKPSKDPKADQLINANLNHTEEKAEPANEASEENTDKGGNGPNERL